MAAPVAIPRGQAQRMCRALRAYDGRLLAVVLVGSSAYAAGLAQDVDLVLISSLPRICSSYAATAHAALADGRVVDVIVKAPGESLGALRLGVASGLVLWSIAGAADVLASGRATLDDFKAARRCLATAATLMSTAAGEVDEQAARYFQEAFHTLFHATRTAVMALRGLQARRVLPTDLQTDFEHLVMTCHIRYGCEARLPTGAGAVRSEFAVWHNRARALIDTAEAIGHAAADRRRAAARAGIVRAGRPAARFG